jgi:hypothetical protein
LRFALSSANTWRTVDIEFDHVEFYRAIINYFEVMPGPVGKAHVDNLLVWWNWYVYVVVDIITDLTGSQQNIWTRRRSNKALSLSRGIFSVEITGSTQGPRGCR